MSCRLTLPVRSLDFNFLPSYFCFFSFYSIDASRHVTNTVKEGLQQSKALSRSKREAEIREFKRRHFLNKETKNAKWVRLCYTFGFSFLSNCTYFSCQSDLFNRCCWQQRRTKLCPALTAPLRTGMKSFLCPFFHAPLVGRLSFTNVMNI